MVRLLLLLACASSVEPDVEKQSIEEWAQDLSLRDKYNHVRAYREDYEIRLLTHPDAEVRKRIADALSTMAPDKRSIPTLAVALQTEPEPEVQFYLIHILGEFASIGEPKAVEALVIYWLLGPHSAERESEAVRGILLGGIKDPGLVEAALKEHAHLSPERAAELPRRMVEEAEYCKEFVRRFREGREQATETGE